MHRSASSVRRLPRGFTLLEVLLVIAIIAILAAIVIIAINPGKQLEDARNTQRRSDVNTIINAIYQYSIDNSGDLPGGLDLAAALCPMAADNNICTTGGACAGILDIGALTVAEEYLVSMPTDPTDATANDTGYRACKSGNGRVTVDAPFAENTAISVTR